MAADPPELSELLAILRHAFAGVRLGNGIGLHRARHRDDHWHDVPTLAVLDPEVEWTEVPDEKLVRFHDTINFLDPEGYRFYLPAFLRWVLTESDDWWGESFINSLVSYDVDGEWKKPFQIAERLAILTPIQLEAVALSVRYLARPEGRWAEQAYKAWSKYWRAL